MPDPNDNGGERALRSTEERFHLLSAALPIGVFFSDAFDHCLYVNRRWQEITGFRVEECLGEGWKQAIDPKERGRVLAGWAAGNGEDVMLEFSIITPRNERRRVRFRTAPMRDRRGVAIGRAGTLERLDSPHDPHAPGLEPNLRSATKTAGLLGHPRERMVDPSEPISKFAPAMSAPAKAGVFRPLLARGSAEVQGATPPRKPRILVVDANPVNLKVALGQLRQMQHPADAVSNGREMFEALEGTGYDILLMDLEMPEFDGYEAARRIRSGEAHWRYVGAQAMHIIAVTGHAGPEHWKRCLQAGMNGFISKPLRRQALEDALKRWQPARAGDISVSNPERQRVPSE